MRCGNPYQIWHLSITITSRLRFVNLFVEVSRVFGRWSNQIKNCSTWRTIIICLYIIFITKVIIWCIFRFFHPIIGKFLIGLGYVVGIGNLIRFPYVAYHYGGVGFLIPYCMMYILVGIPLMFLEVSIGQYSKLGAHKVTNTSFLFMEDTQCNGCCGDFFSKKWQISILGKKKWNYSYSHHRIGAQYVNFKGYSASPML